VDSPPLSSVKEYPFWLQGKDIQTLIIDERLNEQKDDGSEHAEYYGHDVVDAIRKALPTFPIFVVTAFKDDEELLKRYKAVEGVFDRNSLLKELDVNVSRMLRAGEHFAVTRKSDLARLSELATKAAVGKASEKDFEDIRVLQVALGFGDSLDTLKGQAQILDQLEKKLVEFNNVSKKIDTFIAKSRSK
jgi:hypothetical protein